MRYANAMWRHSISFKMLLAYVAGVLLSILLIASAALAVSVAGRRTLSIARWGGRRPFSNEWRATCS